MRPSLEATVADVAQKLGWIVRQRDMAFWEVRSTDGTWIYGGKLVQVSVFIHGAQMRDYYPAV